MAAPHHSTAHICRHCGTEFTGRKRKFCSVACRDSATRIRVHGRLRGDPLTCKHCGNEFTGTKRKFCTPACQQKAAEQRKAARGIKSVTGKRRRPPNSIIDGHRVCLDCERNLPIDEFPVYPHAKSGHRGQCKPCFAEFNRKRKKEAPKVKRSHQMERIRSLTNKGECGPPTREQHAALCRRIGRPKKKHPTEAAITRAAIRNAGEAWRHHIKVMASDEWCERYYVALGKPWLNPRIESAEQWKLRYQGDVLFNLAERQRSAKRKQMKRARTNELLRQSLSSQKRSKTLETRFGYTLEMLKSHLEKQFTKGMSWERFFAGDIHIDHITPKSLFDVSRDDEFLACWCLSNLRPMWAWDNLEKGARQVQLC